jgi:hypothetical protein
MRHILKFNSVVFRLRSLLRMGHEFDSTEMLFRHGMELLNHPELYNAKRCRNRKERRRLRITAPERRPGYVLYRSDGAARGQGHTSETEAAWGQHSLGPQAKMRIPY